MATPEIQKSPKSTINESDDKSVIATIIHHFINPNIVNIVRLMLFMLCSA